MSESDPRASLLVQLWQVERLVEAALLPTLIEMELTVDLWGVLDVVDRHEGIRMSDVALAAVVTPPTLSRHVDKLTSRALVTRVVSAEDKRQAVLAITPLGRRVVARLRQAERAAEAEVAAASGDDLLIRLRGELERILLGAVEPGDRPPGSSS